VNARRGALGAALVRLTLLTGSVLLAGCSGTLDVGNDLEQPLLPVGPSNPIILCNDGATDNWQGEYAILLAQRASPRLAGIVVSTGGMWFDLNVNLSGWQELVTAGRASGLSNLPDPITSVGPPLARPVDDLVEATTPNDSEGARFIVETSRSVAEPGRPAVVVTGGRLTDVADAYLLDPTVADRVVVVSSLGTASAGGVDGGRMGLPNGEMDPWAGWIVSQRFRYVQVSAHYDQLADVPAARLPELPSNPLGDWMTRKQPQLLDIEVASDQVGVLALGVPAFTREVVRVSPSGWEGNDVLLAPDPAGNGWLVTASDADAPGARLWELLLDPRTFGN
jgi:hypothetical protein